MKAYKLVTQDGFSRRGKPGETQWLPIGTVVAPTGEGTLPCGPGVLHGYITPEVALLMNPAHARIANPRLLEIDSDAGWETDGAQRWTTGLCTTVGELPVPVVTRDEHVAFAICVAPHSVTREWAIGWLSGTNTDRATAEEAAQAAMWSARAAAKAAAMWAAAQAAMWAAAEAAEAAAEAAMWAAAEAALSSVDFERRLPLVFARARAILAGEFPAERYDQAYEEDER